MKKGLKWLIAATALVGVLTQLGVLPPVAQDAADALLPVLVGA